MLSIKLLISVLLVVVPQAIYPVAQQPGGQRDMSHNFWMLSIGSPTFIRRPALYGWQRPKFSVVVVAQYTV